MQLVTRNGKKTAVINVFVDPERGFSDLTLTDLLGGVLYVPCGEQVTPLMGDIIQKSRATLFVLGQDYHPANHISFMVNHPGVMEYRIEKFRRFLIDQGQEIATEESLYRQAQQPVHFFNGLGQPPVPFPFEEIVLDDHRDIIGVKQADGRIRTVEIATSSGLAPSEKDRGRVARVRDEYMPLTFDEYRAQGSLLSTQTLWTKHCVQGTDSSLYPDDMMLPQELKDKMAGDLKSDVIYHRDAATGNEFYVIRKGAQSELDSYGIGVENDGETETPAKDVFRDIARQLKKLGCEKVVINVGGLATNFCVEFSANNIADFLAGHFKMRGMQVETNYVPEISRGIPIPGGAETPYSLEGAPTRMKNSRGIHEISIEKILSMTIPGRPRAGVMH